MIAKEIFGSYFETISVHDQIFLQFCLDKLEEHGFAAELSASSVENDYSYFSEDEKIIKVVAKKNWYSTFVHEFCHFLQFLDGMITEVDGLDPFTALEEWFGGKNFSDEFILDCCHMVAQDELDCEKRVVKMIDEYKLSIDRSDYIRMSNCYVCCYYLMPKYKKWLKIDPYYLKYWFPATLEIDHSIWAFIMERRLKDVFI